MLWRRGKSYSQDLRERVFAAADDGEPVGRIATMLPDATIAELRAWLLETHKISASTGLMNKTLAALDLTVKKSLATPPSRRAGMLPRRASNGASSSRS